ncbi:MAG: hypothetical protein Q9196_006197 [Gyalolechia fulgens]
MGSNCRRNRAEPGGAYYEGSATSDALNFVTQRAADNPRLLPSGEAPSVLQSQHQSQQVSIVPITEATISSFRRIISLLLPIRYPDKFFAESIANPTSSSLARVVIWHERPRTAKRKQEQKPSHSGDAPDLVPSNSNSSTTTQPDDVPGTVVGGIQCRLEQLPFHPSLIPFPKPPLDDSESPRKYCYIQTLALLSPYRSKGIGTALLEAIITTLCTEQSYKGTASIYAHVWEANEEALEWYVTRGFQIGNVVKGYYTRLKPAGAIIVWKDLGVKDYLRQQSK